MCYNEGIEVIKVGSNNGDIIVSHSLRELAGNRTQALVLEMGQNRKRKTYILIFFTQFAIEEEIYVGMT